MPHQFSVQDLPLTSDLWIRRGNYLHLTLTAKQLDGSDVSWFGYTPTLVVPANTGTNSVVLNPALVGEAGAGEIELEINTQGEAADTRGPWSLTVVQGSFETTLWQGRLIMEEAVATRLRMEDGCGLEIDSDCGEPIVVYVPAQGIQGIQGIPGSAGPIPSISAESIQIAELLSVDAAGKVQKADASVSGGKFRAIAVADETVGAADLAIDIIDGGRHALRFASAPAAALNGGPAFLSMTPGLATMTPPAYPADTGNVILPVGILEGGDGATVTPDVLLNFQRLIRI